MWVKAGSGTLWPSAFTLDGHVRNQILFYYILWTVLHMISASSFQDDPTPTPIFKHRTNQWQHPYSVHRWQCCKTEDKFSSLSTPFAVAGGGPTTLLILHTTSTFILVMKSPTSNPSPFELLSRKELLEGLMERSPLARLDASRALKFAFLNQAHGLALMQMRVKRVALWISFRNTQLANRLKIVKSQLARKCKFILLGHYEATFFNSLL